MSTSPPRVDVEAKVPRVDLSSPPAWVDRLRSVHPVYVAIPAVLIASVFLLWLFRQSSPTTTQVIMPDPAQPPAEQVVAEVWPENPLVSAMPWPVSEAAQRLIGSDPSSPCMTDPAAMCFMDFEVSVATFAEFLRLPVGVDVCALDFSRPGGEATFHLGRTGPPESVPFLDCTTPAAGAGVPIPADGMIPAAPAAAGEFEGE